MNRNFPSKSQSDLETELSKIEDEILAGKTRTSVSAGDISTTSQMTMSPQKRKKLILWDLHKLDPDNYDAPINRVRPSYV